MSSDGSETPTTADAVAEQWRLTRAQWDRVKQTPDVLEGLYPTMADIIDAAYAVPVLRQFFASTSLTTLCFSTCAEHFYSGDIPAIEPVSSTCPLIGLRDPVTSSATVPGAT